MIIPSFDNLHLVVPLFSTLIANGQTARIIYLFNIIVILFCLRIFINYFCFCVIVQLLIKYSCPRTGQLTSKGLLSLLLHLSQAIFTIFVCVRKMKIRSSRNLADNMEISENSAIVIVPSPSSSVYQSQVLLPINVHLLCAFSAFI